MSDTSEQFSKYFDELTEPNPLRKKCLKPPLSIFPQVQLPTFSFSNEKYPLLQALRQTTRSPQKYKEKSQFRSRSQSPQKKPFQLMESLFIVEESQLRILFADPIFTFSKRLSRGSNKNFTNIKVFPQQSHIHEPLNDNMDEFFSSDTFEDNYLFESRFECGNLAMVTRSKIFENEYYLLLTKDLNTARCTQWFFFRVLNKQKGKLTFHFLNLFKDYSSFEYGMQICMASRSNNYTWERGGYDIKYRRTNIKSGQKNLYCLSFSHQFKNNNDVTFFSYSYPYTYSRLDSLLFKLQNQHSDIFKRRSIGDSLGGNSIDMVTITNFKSSSEDKKIVLLTARIHPGQTPSSFVMEGILKQLIGSSPEMSKARQSFIFKLIPMLNPDGVINGNYRCSLIGYDLNRIWNNCDKEKFPQIFAIKKMLQSSKKPFLFIDLHAHSKKKGAFMYGCSLKTNPFLCREIPFLLMKNIPSFNYFQCNFSISNRQRQGTARMNLFKEFGVSLSYTMQHSFCSSLKQRNHFTVFDYFEIGQKLILTIEKFYGRRRKRNLNQIDDELKQLYQNKSLLKVGENQENDSSDSQLEEEFEIQLESHRVASKHTEKVRVKSKLNFKIQKKQQMKTPRQPVYANFNFNRSSSFRQKATCSETKISKKPNYSTVSKIGLMPNYNLKNSQKIKLQSPNQIRLGSDPLQKNQEQDETNKTFIKPAIRYSEEQVKNLTNLFLPSVTSSSYKKYHHPKIQNKSIVHVGRKFLQNAGLLKQQIRSGMKRKIEWNTPNTQTKN